MIAHFILAGCAMSPPPPPPRPAFPPLRAPSYNLQVYGYNGVASPHFPANTCGNKWLGLYNACPATGGIGHCGKWDTTVDKMVKCGLQNDASIPWKNSSKGPSRQEVLQEFCECISCAFLPAVRDNATLVIPRQCTKSTPSLKSVVEQLAGLLCSSVAPNALDQCSTGFKWSSKVKCERGEAVCQEFEFRLGLASTDEFDANAQLDFLGRLAGLAGVPIDSLYIKSVQAGSVVVKVGVHSDYSDAVAAAVTSGRGDGAGDGGLNANDLSDALGAPVEAVRAPSSAGGGGGFGSIGNLTGRAALAAAILFPILFALILVILCWRWNYDRCKGIHSSEAAEERSTSIVEIDPSKGAPPPPMPPADGGEPDDAEKSVAKKDDAAEPPPEAERL